MFSELLVALVVSSALPALVTLIKAWLGKDKQPEPEPVGERLRKLLLLLSASSQEVDKVLKEITETVAQREYSLQELQAAITKLESEEGQIKQRIQDLQNVPIPVAEHFLNMTEKGERRSAQRDYILFIAGALASTLIAIGLKLLGWA